MVPLKIREIAASLVVLGVLATIPFASLAQNAARSSFGPTEHLTGVLFSNFENLKVFICKPSDTACAHWSEGEAYSLECVSNACNGLLKAVSQAEHDPERLVYMKIIAIARRSLQKEKPTFIGDPGQALQVSAVESHEVLLLPK